MPGQYGPPEDQVNEQLAPEQSYSQREREMIEFLRGRDAVHHTAGLEARHGWGRRTASNTLWKLYERGAIEKVYPDAQPLMPVRLKAGV